MLTRVPGMQLRVSLLVLSALLVGCGGPKTVKRQVTVRLAPEAEMVDNFEVHVVGLTQEQSFQWGTDRASLERAVNEYFYSGEGSGRRQPEAVTRRMTFSSGSGGTTHTIQKDDPIWRTWSGLPAFRLYVLAKLPGQGFANGRATYVDVWSETPSRKGNVSLEVTDEGLRHQQ